MMPNVTQSPAHINPQIRQQVTPGPANHAPRPVPTPFQLAANTQPLSQISPNMQSQVPSQLPNGVRPNARPFAWPTMGLDMFRRAHNTYCDVVRRVLDVHDWVPSVLILNDCKTRDAAPCRCLPLPWAGMTYKVIIQPFTSRRAAVDVLKYASFIACTMSRRNTTVFVFSKTKSRAN